MTAPRQFRNENPQMLTPLLRFENVTPADGTDLTFMTRSIHLQVGGALAIHMSDGTAFTFPGLAAGWHPIQASRVLSTGTTATGITIAD